MPHPNDTVTVSTSTETSASPRETFTDALLIGTAPTANEPTAGFNTVTRHYSATSVSDDYGVDSDVHTAAKGVFQNGASNVLVTVIERTEKTGVLADSDSSAVGSGVIPDETGTITGVAPVSISIDGTAVDTVYASTTSPPTDPTTDAAPETGVAVYNPDTLEVVTGDSSTGTGSGIEVTYSTLGWTGGFDALYGLGADIVAFADVKFDRSHIGDLTELTTYAESNDIALMQPYVDGRTLGSAEDGLAIAQEVGAYAPCKYALPVANESSDELGGYLAGRFATNRFDYDIYLKDLSVSMPLTSRYERLIGAPEQPGTFEGGSSGATTGAGPSNVLVNYGGAVLSNSLTTAGVSSDYRYLDVARTEAFIKSRAKTAVSDRFRDTTVKFNDKGRTSLQQAIEQELAPYTGGDDAPFRLVNVYVPPGDELAQQSRANRIWEGIVLEVQLTGNAHRATIDLRITL